MLQIFGNIKIKKKSYQEEQQFLTRLLRVERRRGGEGTLGALETGCRGVSRGEQRAEGSGAGRGG